MLRLRLNLTSSTSRNSSGSSSNSPSESEPPSQSQLPPPMAAKPSKPAKQRRLQCCTAKTNRLFAAAESKPVTVRESESESGLNLKYGILILNTNNFWVGLTNSGGKYGHESTFQNQPCSSQAAPAATMYSVMPHMSVSISGWYQTVRPKIEVMRSTCCSIPPTIPCWMNDRRTSQRSDNSWLLPHDSWL